jgi:hypothetical protein
MGPRPDHKVITQHKHTFAANTHSFFYVRTLSNFMCANSWLNYATGRTLGDGTEVPRSARVCTLCPRFRGVIKDPLDEMHIFVCPHYEPQKGTYPRVYYSRAYQQFYSAHANKLSEVDTLFRTFPHSPSWVLRPACGARISSANLKYSTELIQNTVQAHHIINMTRWIICSSHVLSFESTLSSFPSLTRKLLDHELMYTVSWKYPKCT